MPSQPVDIGWSFSSVYDLIGSDTQDISSPVLTPSPRHSKSTVRDNDGGIHLGSFAKLYESLGFPQDAPLALPPLDFESELSNSDDALLPSPIVQSSQSPEDVFSSSNDDQLVADTGLNKKQRQKARKRAERERLQAVAKDEEERKQLEFRKQLEALAEAAAKKRETAISPSKPSRAQSRSNVSAKIRAPSPELHTKEKRDTKVMEDELKTPKAQRPVVLKRPSTTTSKIPQHIQKHETPSIQEAVSKVAQFTTPKKIVPLQHPTIPQQSVAHLQLPQAATPILQGQGLVPRTVRPITVPRRSQPVVPQMPATPTPAASHTLPHHITSLAHASGLQIRSQTDRHFHLFNKLITNFPDDRKWLVSPMQLIGDTTASHGLHIFVDASNIMIGFKDMLRNYGIPPYQYDISFDSLALLMERRRPVAKRFFAGSHREANPLPHVTKLVDTSRAVGYDSVMQEQVLIVREDSEKKKFFNDVKKHGWHRATQFRSGSGSDSETGPPAPKMPSAPKWVEQGVDEILHLKMCQSILDTDEPSTMVLATGDGAVAEMSDGFLAHVERALKKGWKVELISWAKQTNGGYKNRKFRAKWGEQFQIIELDEFLEDLIDTP